MHIFGYYMSAPYLLRCGTLAHSYLYNNHILAFTTEIWHFYFGNIGVCQNVITFSWRAFAIWRPSRYSAVLGYLSDSLIGSRRNAISRWNGCKQKSAILAEDDVTNLRNYNKSNRRDFFCRRVWSFSQFKLYLITFFCEITPIIHINMLRVTVFSK